MCPAAVERWVSVPSALFQEISGMCRPPGMFPVFKRNLFSVNQLYTAKRAMYLYRSVVPELKQRLQAKHLLKKDCDELLWVYSGKTEDPTETLTA